MYVVIKFVTPTISTSVNVRRSVPRVSMPAWNFPFNTVGGFLSLFRKSDRRSETKRRRSILRKIFIIALKSRGRLIARRSRDVNAKEKKRGKRAELGGKTMKIYCLTRMQEFTTVGKLHVTSDGCIPRGNASFMERTDVTFLASLASWGARFLAKLICCT